MSYSYRDQLEIIERIKIREGDYKRIDCPFCGGKKTFTLDRLTDGKLLWNCYKASCPAKGSKQLGRSIQAAKDYVDGRCKAKPERKPTPLPEMTTHIRNKVEAVKYLESVNSMDAFNEGLIRIRYAPKQNRVLFYNSDHTGAVGRLLGGAGPKWLSYGDVGGGIHVGSADTGVIVEDAASACAIARLQGFTGIALLGTNLTSLIKNTLQLYNTLYILLDNDAASKAVQMSRRIRGKVYLRTTTADPKDLTTDQLIQILANTVTKD